MTTDDEAFEHLPAVNEFRLAVVQRDVDVVEACFMHTDPRVLAVWCAEMWDQAKCRAEDALTEARMLRVEVAARAASLEGAALRREAAQVPALKAKVRELRGYLDQVAAGKPAGKGRLAA